MKQERYHEWLKRKFKETRIELDTDRSDIVEHDISLEWIRFFEKRHNKNSNETI